MADAGTGWITEDGAYIATPYYRHVQDAIAALPEWHPVAQWVRPRYEALAKYKEEKTQDFYSRVSTQKDILLKYGQMTRNQSSDSFLVLKSPSVAGLEWRGGTVLYA